MRSFLIVLFVLTSVLTKAYGQSAGCTDPLALNFDERAEVNDGSCRYAPVVHTPPFAFELPGEVSETSGLVFHKGLLWTHNDSGGKPVLYGLDTTSAKIVSRLTVSNASAIDWEEITSDEDYLYIGDFGNNSGTRRDLTIYRISIDALSAKADTTVRADVIGFHYPEQKEFKKSKTHSFDCEAFVAFNDNLYLFTKDRWRQNTQLYRLPAVPGKHAAVLLADFPSGGLITGASLNEFENELILVGYVQNLWTPFLWIFTDFEEDQFFSANKRRIDLVNLATTQTEAVCHLGNKQYFISAESSPTFSARTFRFDSSPWTDSITDHPKGKALRKIDVQWVRPEDKGWGKLVVRSGVGRKARLEITDADQRLLYRGYLGLKKNEDFVFPLDGLEINGNKLEIILVSGRKFFTSTFER